LSEQPRQGELYSIPEDVAIDVEVGVRQSIAHAYDLLPGYAAQFRSTGVADLISGFADDLGGAA